MNDVKVYKSEIHGYPAFAIEINGLMFYRTQQIKATDNQLSLNEKIIVALCKKVLNC